MVGLIFTIITAGIFGGLAAFLVGLKGDTAKWGADLAARVVMGVVASSGIGAPVIACRLVGRCGASVMTSSAPADCPDNQTSQR